MHYQRASKRDDQATVGSVSGVQPLLAK